MRKVIMRPTHFTFHQQGPAPRFRAQADEATAHVRLEFAARAQLLAPARAAERTADNYFDTTVGGSGVAAVALQLTAGKVSYTLPNAIWERLKVNPHIFYRVTATAQTPIDWNAAEPRTVRSIDDARAATGVATYLGVPRDTLHDAWNFPDQTALALVPEYYRAKLSLLTRHHETHESAYLLRRLGGQTNYTSLPDAQRCKALLVFAATDTPARRALVQLFEREIPATAAGAAALAAVRSTDLSSERKTLLDQLALLVDLDPHLDIPDGMDVLVAEAIEEVADPSFEINQGAHATCVPTSVSWLMSTYFPAEYIRLCRNLISERASVPLANGDSAAVPTDSYRYDAREQASGAAAFLQRSWSERLFQSAMMAYSRPGLSYSNLADLFSDGRTPTGLTQPELLRMLRGLRNRVHREVSGTGAELVTGITQRLAQPCLPILTAMNWNGGGHMVVSVRSDATDVVVRNPWGDVNYRVGQVLNPPPRRCINPAQAEEAIARADMAAAIRSFVVED